MVKSIYDDSHQYMIAYVIHKYVILVFSLVFKPFSILSNLKPLNLRATAYYKAGVLYQTENETIYYSNRC